MSVHDATPSRGIQVVIPSHLLPWMRSAADYELELACDAGGEWNPLIRERVLRAARTISTLEAGLVTAHTIERLTSRASTRSDTDHEAVPELLALRDLARRRVSGG